MKKKTPENETLTSATMRIRKMAEEGKVTSAVQSRVNEFPRVRDTFLARVLKHPEAWISDMSSIYDFDAWIPGIRILTMDVFGVDIEPILEKGGRLYEIFEYISRKPEPDLTLEEIAEEYGLRKKIDREV